MTKHIANILTFSRIVGSIFLLFCPAFSAAFYILYLYCGFSDMTDGAVAKKTMSITTFGSRLDTAADLIFAVVSAIKLLPALRIPLWLLLWAGAIAVIKISTVIWVFVFRKQFVSLHTVMNKITGLMLFLLPLTVSFAELKYACAVVCSAATFSAIQESVYVLSGRKCG